MEIIFDVYFNPPTHPGRWVVKHQLLENGVLKPYLYDLVFDTYDEVVNEIPWGLTRIPHENHPQGIFETWR